MKMERLINNQPKEIKRGYLNSLIKPMPVASRLMELRIKARRFLSLARTVRTKFKALH